MTTDPRTNRVQGLRRSNAAGPHKTTRYLLQAEDAAKAIEEAEVELYTTRLQQHRVTFQPDYGVRFVCSCGEVSPYYTSKDAARMAHADHVHPAPRAAGTEPLD